MFIHINIFMYKFATLKGTSVFLLLQLAYQVVELQRHVTVKQEVVEGQRAR